MYVYIYIYIERESIQQEINFFSKSFRQRLSQLHVYIYNIYIYIIYTYRLYIYICAQKKLPKWRNGNEIFVKRKCVFNYFKKEGH